MNNDLKEMNELAKCMTAGKIFHEEEKASMKALNWANVLEQVSKGRGNRK